MYCIVFCTTFLYYSFVSSFLYVGHSGQYLVTGKEHFSSLADVVCSRWSLSL